MGYVLPVSQFQYQDYKRRVTPDKQNKFYVDRSQRPKLERNYQDVMSKAAYYRRGFKVNKQYISDRYDDVLYAEITGKGGYVSERV